MYIQEAGNSNYANQKSKNNSLANTGKNNDEVCKINDMASNIFEWTTEYSSRTEVDTAYPSNFRGDYCDFGFYTARRDSNCSTNSDVCFGFRLSLYF